jgi:hypothetical protein
VRSTALTANCVGVYDLRFRYRFRLVSISCDANWKFSIDNHIMTIIEVEGTNAQPLNVDQIQIFAGQRYSFVVSIYIWHVMNADAEILS